MHTCNVASTLILNYICGYVIFTKDYDHGPNSISTIKYKDVVAVVLVTISIRESLCIVYS